MNMEHKQIAKDDGRYLVYYHFPDGATPDETRVFHAIEAASVVPDAPANETTQQTMPASVASGGSHV